MGEDTTAPSLREAFESAWNEFAAELAEAALV
jgi:hypothetical protein